MRIAALALLALLPIAASAAGPKHHEVTLGTFHTAPGSPDTRIRALMVDGQFKHWTTGESHDVTSHTFTIRSIDKLNDTLPGDPAHTPEHWIWQPGPWLLVDRVTARVTVLHLPDFDANISDVVWFRDLAAYCGKAPNGKKLIAVVAQLGIRGALVRKPLESMNRLPDSAPATRVCSAIEWQRAPLRVSLTPSGGEPIELSLALNLPIPDQPSAKQPATKEPVDELEPASAPVPALKTTAASPPSPKN